MSEPESKVDANKIMDELLKATSSCYGCFGKSEEWSDVEVNEVKNELERASKNVDMNGSKTYVLSDGKKKEVVNEVVKNYQESLLNVNMIDIDSRNEKNEVEIDFRFKYFDEIVRYMKNEYDISELNGIEFVDFCRELMEMNIPFKMDIMKILCNGFNEYGVGWKNRCLIVNGNEYKMIFDYMKLRLSELKYNEETDRYEYVIEDKYEPIIQSLSIFIGNTHYDCNGLIENLDRRTLNEFINEGIIDLDNENVHSFFYSIYSPFLRNTILFGQEYDVKLREWIGNDYKWKLLYRASEHEYTAKSFHECCDDKGPTLVIIKSSNGCVFGGYTTQSWRERGYKDDAKAFIFTLKNPHGVEPTRYMKREESKYAIQCYPNYGSLFGNHYGSDICIRNNCNEESSCWIDNDGRRGYECHPQYKSSLFVNTAGPDEENKFSVLDYEVFGIDFEIKENINKLCKYPDIIWEYIETKDISEESLKQFDDDIELLNDFNAIHCLDSNIRLKISQLCLKNPSELLVNTQLVDKKYDIYLKKWAGDYKWKLLYRASEHDYTAKSFHEYCDEKRPTFVLIKSSEGWIFGGYTTESWSGRGFIYKDDSKAFIFTLKNPHGVEPTRYKKRKESEYTIKYDPDFGPRFGNDICISDHCNEENSCTIRNDGNGGYECHPEYKSSLFVNTSGPEYANNFTVLDYEVFGIDYENRENINKLCKHPDIIWKYLETRDISEESLKEIEDDIELLTDLDAIHCEVSNIRVKISRYFFTNPSELLPDTQLVNKRYDNILREWLGNDYKWKLLYRASEHNYTSKSFHDYCDNKGPTLIVIKSSGGWIFGGYTTQSWNKFEDKDDDKAFIFTLKNPHGVEPTRYMKREGSHIAIICSYKYGPIFGNNRNNCDNICYIGNNGTNGYECHSVYKKSLFVNTAGPEEKNLFTVFDYEVYTHN